MADPTFPPGPWRIRDEDGPPLTDIMVGDRLLATVYPEHYKLSDPRCYGSADAILRRYAEAEATARLISAAPELAEIASEAPVLSKYHGAAGFEVERFTADYEAWSAKRRTVLAKARGEG